MGDPRVRVFVHMRAGYSLGIIWYLGMNKLQALADKIENKLKKVGAMPDEESVRQIIESVYQSLKSNPLLKNTQGIAPKIYLSGSIGEKVLVYFQVLASTKSYEYLLVEPQKSELSNLLKPAVEQALQNHFRQYEFSVKIGIAL